jgi:hypothetical protein
MNKPLPVPGPIVVKVGGSLFDLPDLGSRLQSWLDRLPTRQVLLVPGGGPTADVVRELDRRHGLGDERAHWLALRALMLNAYFLAELLPSAAVVENFRDCLVQRGSNVPPHQPDAQARDQPPSSLALRAGMAAYPSRDGLGPRRWDCPAIVDAHAFARLDEGEPGSLPHCWAVTSDAVAARVAVVSQARELVLLKSTDAPPGSDWRAAGKAGFVDALFAEAIGAVPVRVVNLRQWRP